MLLLPTKTCWGLLAFRCLADTQEMLPTLINMLPPPSQTNSTFEILPSHQRTEPVPDVGGCGNNTQHTPWANSGRAAALTSVCDPAPARTEPPVPPWWHQVGGGEHWIRACSTPAHVLCPQCPRGDGISSPEIKGSFPLCFWLCLHSHHCTISPSHQSLSSSLCLYEFRMQEGDEWKHMNYIYQLKMSWGLGASNPQVTGAEAFPNTSVLAGSKYYQHCTFQHLIYLYRFDTMSGDPKLISTINTSLSFQWISLANMNSCITGNLVVCRS